MSLEDLDRILKFVECEWFPEIFKYIDTWLVFFHMIMNFISFVCVFFLGDNYCPIVWLLLAFGILGFSSGVFCKTKMWEHSCIQFLLIVNVCFSFDAHVYVMYVKHV